MDPRLGHADDVCALVESVEFFQPSDPFGTSQNVATFNGPGLHLEATIHGHGSESEKELKEKKSGNAVGKSSNVAKQPQSGNLSKSAENARSVVRGSVATARRRGSKAGSGVQPMAPEEFSGIHFIFSGGL